MNLPYPLKSFLLFNLIISLFLGSCKNKKEDAPLPAPELSAEKEISRAEADLNSVLRDITIYESSDGNDYNLDPTLPYTYKLLKDSTVGVYSKCLLVTYAGFGTDNLSRSGLVKCFFSGRKATGTYRDSIVFENAKIAGREIKGRITSKQTITGKDTMVFAIAANGSIDNAKGLPIEFTSLKVKKRTSVSSKNVLEDTWQVSGSWSGTTGSGEKVTLQTPAQLEILASCSVRYFTKGVVDFNNLSTGVSRRIKYGDGKCDAFASFVNDKGIEYLFSVD